MSAHGMSEAGGLREEWRPIPGFEGRYEVSSIGRVRSLPGGHRSGRVLKQGATESGYRIVGFGGKSWRVHRLVAMAFIPGSGDVVRHLNDRKTDNRVENLAWGTQSENAWDAIANGCHGQGSKTHCPSGHGYTPENTYLDTRGYRDCRTCRQAPVTCSDCGIELNRTSLARHRRRNHQEAA